MCNRFRSIKNADAVRDRFGMPFRVNFEPNPNVAPTDIVPIVRASATEGRVVQLARFGMIPSWAKDKKIGTRFLNARVETVRTTPAYRQAFQQRRCIVPTEGYYEWREENGKKQPYLFSRKDGDVTLLAGLWDYVELDGEEIFSFTLITGEPNSLSKPIHDRMPCILQNDKIDQWFDLKTDGTKELIQFPSELMSVRSVDSRVNKATVKDMELFN